MSRGMKKLRAALNRALLSLAVAKAAGTERHQAGAALVEYSLLLGLVAVAALGALLLLGGYVSQDLSNTARGFGP